jgi:hypothetical protein
MEEEIRYLQADIISLSEILIDFNAESKVIHPLTASKREKYFRFLNFQK